MLLRWGSLTGYPAVSRNTPLDAVSADTPAGTARAVPAGFTSAWDDGHGAQRTAAATVDLHRQPDEEESPGRQPLQVGDVLEDRDVRGSEDAMAPERRRLAVVDARRVETDGPDVALAYQPARAPGVKAGEVELGHRLRTQLRRAQVSLA